MDINSTTQTQTSTGGKSNIAGDQSLSETFDNFLLLLTTQLQNQDPLDPMDSAKFTEQLVAFSGVEQQLKTNDKLDQLINGQAFNEAAQLVGFLGKYVEAEGDRVNLTEGGAPIVYDLAGEAERVEILLTDSSGRTVRTIEGPTGAGRHELIWDGADDFGNPAELGGYTIQVRATDAEDATVDAKTFTIGKISGVETIDGILQLMVGDAPVRVEDITAFRDPIAAS
ncbi:MAG: flagellar hook capping FlgD N-terminal domain-containing protein [Tistlia sp.]|uniref:flagellar hook assembly protein FlgD n=1 Tax=Tistlia sp. TaxID=3057121 RepID=UPI0034A4AA4F